MKFVIDTNVLITYFWSQSIIHDLLLFQFDLISPEYALEEINDHADEIMKKTKITKDIFSKRKMELARTVEFIPLEEYESEFQIVLHLFKNQHHQIDDALLKDIDFYALAIKVGCPIWTNDKGFKKQKDIMVMNTKEIISLLKMTR
jgi:predicted nucleic acid-binding protein